MGRNILQYKCIYTYTVYLSYDISIKYCLLHSPSELRVSIPINSVVRKVLRCCYSHDHARHCKEPKGLAGMGCVCLTDSWDFMVMYDKFTIMYRGPGKCVGL